MDSPAYGVRCVNNWVKATLIERCCVRRGAHVLDLCAGRGGDLQKWQRSGVASLVHVDSAEEEVNRARERWSGTGGGRPSLSSDMHVRFSCSDAFAPIPVDGHDEDDYSPTPGPNAAGEFDVVSCFFALHYAFERPDRLMGLARRLAHVLRPGGRFVCTYPDAERMVALCVPQCGVYMDELLRVQFDPPGVCPLLLPLFGAQYRFTLRECIDDCPEWLVHVPTLCQTLASVGLVCECEQTFDAYAHETWNRDAGARQSFARMVPKIPSATEWRVSSLYRVAVWRKPE